MSEKAMSMDKTVFKENLKRLVDDAKNNKYEMQYDKIKTYFEGELDDEKYEIIINTLTKNNIDVLTISEDEIEQIDNIKDGDILLEDMDDVEDIEEL